MCLAGSDPVACLLINMMTKEKARDSAAYILGFKPVTTTGHRALVIVSHVLLWGLFLALPLLIYRIRILDATFFSRELITKFFLIILFYVNYYFLLPRFFQRRRIANYFLSITGALLILSALNVVTEYFFREHLRMHPRRYVLTARLGGGMVALKDSAMDGMPFPTQAMSVSAAAPVFPLAGTVSRVDGAVIASHQVLVDTFYGPPGRGRHRLFRGLVPNDSLTMAAGIPAAPFFREGPFGERSIFWMGFSMVLMNSLSSGVIILLLSGFIKLANSLIISEKQKKALENERLNAELNFLKLQINPHFLFNTLNSIYSQAHLKSEQTEYSILKFSQIMRYVLYDSTAEKIPLTRDLEYIRNYIDLQKLRISRNITIQYDVTGVTNDLLIAPLLLITFIENAFKHGISYSSPSAIDIRISVTGKDLTLTVGNTIIRKPAGQEEVAAGGVGLVNARRRLDVLYPNRYLLDISDNNSIYVVNLKITLDHESGHEGEAVG